MALNYDRRLENLQKRRYDNILNESVLSKSFSASDLPKNVKYLMESMLPIGESHNYKIITAAKNVQNHLEAGYNLHFQRAYRRQGSVETNTNIEVHSDIDLLNIIDRYYYTEPSLPIRFPYTASDPDEDIEELRIQALQILRKKYQHVDDSNEKCITIFNKNLRKEVDVVFAYWYHTEEYERSNDEFHRGVRVRKRWARADFPFAHIRQVNAKGGQTLDGSRKGIRLLKTLAADSEAKFKFLKSFQLTTIVHQIENGHFLHYSDREIKIGQAISEKISQIINDSLYRCGIKSPNGCETPLTDDNIIKELKLIKADLDELIFDATSEIKTGWRVKDAMNIYG